MNRITIATIALVVPIVMVTLVTQKQRKPAPKTPTHTSVKQQPSDTESERPDEPSNAEFRERLQELRLKWQVWAREHQEDLAEMLRETGTERAAFDRVLNAMPPALMKDTALIKEDMDAPGFPFVYIPEYDNHQGLWIMPNNTKGYLLRDGDEETFARWRADEELNKKYPKHTGYSLPESGWKNFHDIEIVTTMKSGNIYSLWISGRITERVVNTRRHNDLVIPLFGNYQDVAPPYPFLTQ